LKNTQTRKSAFVKRDSHMLKPAVRNKNRFVGWARFFAHAVRPANKKKGQKLFTTEGTEGTEKTFLLLTAP
jgi:hypothetical protein